MSSEHSTQTSGATDGATRPGGFWNFIGGMALASVALLAYYFLSVVPSHEAQVKESNGAGYVEALKDQADALRLDKPGQYRVIFSGVARIMSDDAKTTSVLQALVVDASPDMGLNPPRYKNVRLLTVPLVQTSGWGLGATHLAFERREVLGKMVETYRFWRGSSDPNGPLVTAAFGQHLDLSFDHERIGAMIEPQQSAPKIKKSTMTTSAAPTTVSANR